jgi:hypothetical protein
MPPKEEVKEPAAAAEKPKDEAPYLSIPFLNQ